MDYRIYLRKPYGFKQVGGGRDVAAQQHSEIGARLAREMEDEFRPCFAQQRHGVPGIGEIVQHRLNACPFQGWRHRAPAAMRADHAPSAGGEVAGQGATGEAGDAGYQRAQGLSCLLH